ncbi:MAG: NAD(+) diphosphatase [Candidatus Promineofilum sp.]|nr:NAD(+) diphosphatase [Promineifilum sp.]
MPPSFVTSVHPPEDTGQPALWFLFRGHRLLVETNGGGARLPRLSSPDSLGLPLLNERYLGYWNGDSPPIHCYCGEIAEDAAPPAGYALESLRPLYSLLDEKMFWLAGRAIQIVEWNSTNRYCGRCGQATVDHENDRAKVCPQCGLTSYPRLAPAVIVRVTRPTTNGSEILLARANRFPTAMFSVLAGFVEPGETLEECVEREIQEEVGITVRNIRYFGSQPWPFPHSLMIAFTADYDAGELAIDSGELAAADWFPPDALPPIPPPPSIANRLIADWLGEP